MDHHVNLGVRGFHLVTVVQQYWKFGVAVSAASRFAVVFVNVVVASKTSRAAIKSR